MMIFTDHVCECGYRIKRCLPIYKKLVECACGIWYQVETPKELGKYRGVLKKIQKSS